MESTQEQPVKKQEHEPPNKDREPLLELNKTLGEIGESIKDLDGVNLTPEQQLRFRKIKKRVLRSTGKFLTAVRRVTAVGAIVGLALTATGVEVGTNAVIDYKINHQALEETVDASGQIIYTHPDERTTHYLNILAGRDKFTDEDLRYANENNETAEDLNLSVVRNRLTEWDLESANRENMTTKDLNILAGLSEFTEEDLERMQREFLKSQLKMLKIEIPPPANIEKMSSLELLTLMFEDPRAAFRPLPHEDARIRAQELATKNNQLLTERLKERAEFSKDMYRLVWQLEREGGNPRIRFNAEGTLDAVLAARPEGSARNSYDTEENIIYIEPFDLISGEGVVAEMSHGKQYKDNPLGSYFQNYRDFINVYLKGGFSAKGTVREYNKLYHKSGTLEYQAHELIQPYLEEKYNLMPYLKQQGGRGNK